MSCLGYSKQRKTILLHAIWRGHSAPVGMPLPFIKRSRSRLRRATGSLASLLCCCKIPHLSDIGVEMTIGIGFN